MRIAVFGGSFDPVHRGHVALADAVQDFLKPDRLYWVPARRSPHKPDLDPAPPEDRLALVQQVVAGRPDEEVLALELERPGPSYTVNTLDALEAIHPGAEITLVLGADVLEDLLAWRDVPGLFQRAALALVPRAGWGLEQLESFRAGLPEELAAMFRAAVLPMDPVEVSSTHLRERLAAGKDCEELLPPGVQEEIRRRGLYCSAT